MTIFWAFTLMWKTFLFRFGLTKRLFSREFPLLALIPIHCFLFGCLTGYRLVSSLIIFLQFHIYNSIFSIVEIHRSSILRKPINHIRRLDIPYFILGQEHSWCFCLCRLHKNSYLCHASELL